MFSFRTNTTVHVVSTSKLCLVAWVDDLFECIVEKEERQRPFVVVEEEEEEKEDDDDVLKVVDLEEPLYILDLFL